MTLTLIKASVLCTYNKLLTISYNKQRLHYIILHKLQHLSTAFRTKLNIVTFLSSSNILKSVMIDRAPENSLLNSKTMQNVFRIPSAVVPYDRAEGYSVTVYAK